MRIIKDDLGFASANTSRGGTGGGGGRVEKPPPEQQPRRAPPAARGPGTHRPLRAPLRGGKKRGRLEAARAGLGAQEAQVLRPHPLHLHRLQNAPVAGGKGGRGGIIAPLRVPGGAGAGGIIAPLRLPQEPGASEVAKCVIY